MGLRWSLHLAMSSFVKYSEVKGYQITSILLHMFHS
jgi:hypothetical protein